MTALPTEVYARDIPFPEGPVADRQGNVFVCARRGGYIARIEPTGRIDTFLVTGGKPNGLAIDHDGALYVADALGRQLLRISPTGDVSTLVPTTFSGHTLVGPNDLCFDAAGALYFTDPGLSMERDDGAVYRYRLGTRALARLASGLHFPNGLAVTPSGATLYFVDTVTSALFHLDLSNSDSSPRQMLTFGDGANPDGMCWLDDIHLLIALHGAGELARVSVRDGCTARWSLARGSHPTNVVVHREHCLITDDAAAGVLRCEVAALLP